MNYEQNRETEHRFDALQDASKRGHRLMRRRFDALQAASTRANRCTRRMLYSALFALLVVLALLGWLSYRFDQHASHRDIVVLAGRDTSAATEARVVCFRANVAYERGESTICDAGPCPIAWKRADDTAPADGRATPKDYAEQTVLSLVVGGHDSAPMAENPRYDSNMQLALRRAEDSAKVLPHSLEPSSIRAALPDLTDLKGLAEFCGPSPSLFNPDANHEARRTSLLLLFVRHRN